MVAVVAVVALVALPLKAAVIVPAVKFPEASLFTIVLAVFKLVAALAAVVAEATFAAVAPPTSGTLFIVGDATQGGWNNPVPVPSQQFTQIDSLTYLGTFALNGGGQFLLLPVNGQWDKYAVANASADGLKSGGTFGFNLSDNFPGPDSTGNYQIKVDFLRGKFTVTKQ